ncbi:MAG: hypothetical protein HLX50_23510, partial [Alteromonadaceae bacterium]|nr:hypothetical protein [Alteromonadaceae bacterium]
MSLTQHRSITLRVQHFSGPAETVQVDEDNQLLKELMKQPGEGRVLVVDGGGKITCALMGGNMAKMFKDSGWAGVVIVGSILDRSELAYLSLFFLALVSNPPLINTYLPFSFLFKLSFSFLPFFPCSIFSSSPDLVCISLVTLLFRVFFDDLLPFSF